MDLAARDFELFQGFLFPLSFLEVVVPLLAHLIQVPALPPLLLPVLVPLQMLLWVREAAQDVFLF